MIPTHYFTIKNDRSVLFLILLNVILQSKMIDHAMLFSYTFKRQTV